MKIDIEKTFIKSVGGNDDFHFYLDELTDNDFMPTYRGVADEKYTFDEMDEDFFRFLQRKADSQGIYIRLIHATGENTPTGARFGLEYGDESEVFETSSDDVLVFDFADYGIKIRGDEVTFGTTVFGGCGQTPFFAEFGSEGSEEFVSADNPLNRRVVEIMKEFVVCEV